MPRRTAPLFMLAAALSAVLAYGLIFGPYAYAGQNTQLAHAIFLKVNGQTITQEQVVEAVHYLVKREFNGVMPRDEEMLEKIQDAAIRDLVRSLLIQSEARKLSLKFRGNLKFLIQRQGLKPEEVTPTIRRLLTSDDLFEDIMMASGTPLRDPSPKEIKDFYLKNRDEFKPNTLIVVRTIFLALDGKQPQSYYKAQGEEMLRQIDAVQPVAKRTEAFAKMAKEKSQDIFAQFGGLLTGDSPEKWIPKSFQNQNPDGSPIFPPTMVEEIRKLNKPGETRLAISDDGVHLLYCEEVQGGKEMTWQEASRIIEFILKERARNRGMRQWISEIYDRSDVRWHDGTEYEKELLTKPLLPTEMGPAE